MANYNTDQLNCRLKNKQEVSNKYFILLKKECRLKMLFKKDKKNISD